MNVRLVVRVVHSEVERHALHSQITLQYRLHLLLLSRSLAHKLCAAIALTANPFVTVNLEDNITDKTETV